jgi:hypothetical protein
MTRRQRADVSDKSTTTFEVQVRQLTTRRQGVDVRQIVTTLKIDVFQINTRTQGGDVSDKRAIT